MPARHLSSSSSNHALQRLAAHAAIEHLVLELALCYGRVIPVVYRATDVKLGGGKIVEPSTRATTLARMVAAEQRLPAHWLEGDLKYFLAFFAARNRTALEGYGSSLIVSISEPNHILAMKLHVCQVSPPSTADLADACFLVQKMGFVSEETVEITYQQFFPGASLGPTLRPIIAGLLAQVS